MNESGAPGIDEELWRKFPDGRPGGGQQQPGGGGQPGGGVQQPGQTQTRPLPWDWKGQARHQDELKGFANLNPDMHGYEQRLAQKAWVEDGNLLPVQYYNEMTANGFSTWSPPSDWQPGGDQQQPPPWQGPYQPPGSGIMMGDNAFVPEPHPDWVGPTREQHYGKLEEIRQKYQSMPPGREKVDAIHREFREWQALFGSPTDPGSWENRPGGQPGGGPDDRPYGADNPNMPGFPGGQPGVEDNPPPPEGDNPWANRDWADWQFDNNQGLRGWAGDQAAQMNGTVSDVQGMMRQGRFNRGDWGRFMPSYGRMPTTVAPTYDGMNREVGIDGRPVPGVPPHLRFR